MNMKIIIKNKYLTQRTILSFLFFLVISCKENNTKANDQSHISPFQIQKQDEKDITNWELIDITRIFDEPKNEEDVVNFKKNKVYFDKNIISINEAKVNFKIQELNPQKILGKGSLYDFFKDYIIKKYGIKLANKVSYINIEYEDATKEPFKKFFLKGNSAIMIDNYLFLFSNDDYLLVYKNQKTNEVNSKSFNTFLNDIQSIDIPINSFDLKNGNSKDSSFFKYDYDKNYYTIDNFNIIGKYKKNNIVYILYNFNLLGEGEGFEEHMVVLSSYYDTGKFIDNIIISGKVGGEGGANIYSSEIRENEILTNVKEEYYESATGLSSPISINKNFVYKIQNNLYKLSSESYQCNETLDQYYSAIKKNFEEKNYKLISGENSYNIKSILSCYPISSKNVDIYNNIAFYFSESGVYSISADILNKIIKTTPTRVVTWLNLADIYWELDEKAKAKDSYQKYTSLMKSQNKDLSKIPQRVYERSK